MRNNFDRSFWRIFSILGTLAFVFVSSSPAQQLSVDEIITKNIAARGGYDALKAIQTVVYSGGTYHEGDFTSDGSSFLAIKRPYYRIVGNPEDKKTDSLEGYDGGSWEWYSDPGVVVRTIGAASGTSRRGSDFEEPFVDYKSKGNKAVLGKTTTIGNSLAYQIIVTLRDGFSQSYFIDAKSFLLIAQRHYAPFHAFGDIVKTETRFSDFRPIAGVLFPFHIGQFDISNGSMLNEITWTKIEANREVPLSWFSPPQYERTPLQKLLENLYAERADADAVLWSYDDVRRANPDVDTRRGIEFIGYQMLKMGDSKSALALLRKNVEDYPNSATAAFGLGRVYKTINDIANARLEFQRALKINPKYKRAADELDSLK